MEGRRASTSHSFQRATLVVPHRNAAESDASYAEWTRGSRPNREKEESLGELERMVQSVTARIRTDLERERVAQQCTEARTYAELVADIRELESRQTSENLDVVAELRLLREGQIAAQKTAEALAREVETLTVEVAKCHAKADRVTSLLETLLQRMRAL
jgi:hypothetical protein